MLGIRCGYWAWVCELGYMLYPPVLPVRISVFIFFGSMANFRRSLLKGHSHTREIRRGCRATCPATLLRASACPHAPLEIGSIPRRSRPREMEEFPNFVDDTTKLFRVTRTSLRGWKDAGFPGCCSPAFLVPALYRCSCILWFAGPTAVYLMPARNLGRCEVSVVERFLH